MLDNTLLEEFVMEAGELLDEAEAALLSLEKKEGIEENFNSSFRVFHSLKGSAGMIGFDSVQKHVHLIEDRLESFKEKKENLTEHTSFFLEAVDHTRLLLEGTQKDFNYNLLSEMAAESNALAGGQTVDEAKKAHDFFIVDLIGLSENELPIAKSLKGKVQFNFIEDVNVYLKKRSYFHTNAVFVSVEKYKEIENKIKDDIPVLIHGCLENKSEKVLIDNIESLSAEHLICSVAHSKVIMRSLMLLDKALKFIFYQYSDLEQYLVDNQRDAARIGIQEEIQNIINLKGELFK